MSAIRTYADGNVKPLSGCILHRRIFTPDTKRSFDAKSSAECPVSSLQEILRNEIRLLKWPPFRCAFLAAAIPSLCESRVRAE